MKAQNKKQYYSFGLKNTFPLIGMKDSLKIYETMEENGFHKPENQFPPARISSAFKNWFPVRAVTVSASRKKLSSKLTVFIREKYPSPMARTKDSFKNKFPGDREKAFSGRSLSKKTGLN